MSDTGQDERLRRQKMRSIAIALGLIALVVLFYVATIVRLGPNALRKDGFSTPRNQTTVVRPVETPACKEAGTC